MIWHRSPDRQSSAHTSVCGAVRTLPSSAHCALCAQHAYYLPARRFAAALLRRLFGKNPRSHGVTHTTRAPPVGFELESSSMPLPTWTRYGRRKSRPGEARPSTGIRTFSGVGFTAVLETKLSRKRQRALVHTDAAVQAVHGTGPL